MAEFVQLRLEQSVPELEMMKATGLYTDSEIRQIILKRRGFEHKLACMQKPSAAEYMEYIDYDLKLIEHVKLRRKVKGVSGKKKAIEFEIANKIEKRFQILLFNYGHDLKYWYSYIEFATKFNLNSSLSRSMRRLVETHQHDPQAWKLMASYYLDTMRNPDKAQKLLMRGLQFNKGDTMLYTELFKIELKRFLIKSEKSRNNNKKLHFDRAFLIMETGIEECTNEDEKINFVVTLLNMTELFEDTWLLQKRIADFLMEKFATNEVMWDTIALKVLEGKHYESSKTLTTEQKLNTCIKIYKAAIENLQTPKSWKLYLERVLNFPIFSDSMKQEALESAYEASLVSDDVFFDERYYLLYAELSPDKTERILKVGLEKFCKSVECWSELLNYYIKQNNESALEETFQKAVNILKENSLTLWNIRLKYYIDKDTKTKEIKKIFEDGIIKNPGSIADVLVMQYLNWIGNRLGVLEGRKIYHKLMSIWPCAGLHIKMFEIEFTVPNPDLKILKTVLEYGVMQAGKNNPQVWLNYIKFARKYEPVNVNSIYERALKTIKDCNTFKIEYELLNRE